MSSAAAIPDKLRTRAAESDTLDFKAEFEDTKRCWCEIVKDIVAMANSYGGQIVFGVTDSGEPSGADISNVAKLDPARITDKIVSYSGVQFSGVSIVPFNHDGANYPAISITPSQLLIAFTKPGTYPTPDEKQQQRTAFAQGTVYVRHGAKSEPANSDDLREFIERRIDEVAEKWKHGIAQVVEAPLDHEVRVVPPGMQLVDEKEAKPIRLTSDESAPAAHFLRPDETHPFRQKELVSEVTKRLGGAVRITGHQIQCVRRVYGTDDDPTFSYAGMFASRQYSVAFVDWLTEQHRADPEFFKSACANAKQVPIKRAVNKPR